MKTKSLFLIICVVSTWSLKEAYGQIGISIDATSPDASAMLDVKSTTKGILIPRMTAAERNAISQPAAGLMIFCTDDEHFYVNKGIPLAPEWVFLDTQWNTAGNGIYYDEGNVGINIPPSPSYGLRVDGAGTMTAVHGRYNDDHYGFLGTSSHGVEGYNLGAAAGNAGVYGYNNSSVLGTPGIYGYNNTSLGGGFYDLDNSVNGVVGYVSKGYAYHFGVFGSRSDDAFGPSAGVVGSVSYNNQNKPWGALGFQDAVQEEYAGYFNGNINITGGLKDGSGFGVSGSVLLSNGSNDVYWSTLAGISGNGTANYIPKWSNATTLSNSLVYDDGTSVCIGTITSSGRLTVNSGGTSTAVYGQCNSNILGYLGSTSYGAYGQNSSTLYGYLGGSYGAYGQQSATQYGYLGGTSNGVYGQNGSKLGYLGGSLYGTYGQSSGTLYGYLGGSNYGAYGQNTASINGYLGGSSYGAYGQYNTTQFGYLGSSGYGAYGQYSSTLYGYLGGLNYGVFGQNGASISGHLAGVNYGAYGQNNTSRFGYLGGSSCGAYGQNSSTLYGYLGGSVGAYGQYNATINGYLGGSLYGSYGQYSSTQYGYLGGVSYGAWGQYASDRYGWLGSSLAGAYGQNTSNIYGYLGTSSYGVKGYHGTAGGAAGYFDHDGAPTTYSSQWAVDADMNNSSYNDGSSYAYSLSGNNSGGIRANNLWGANYTFAVAGWNYNDYTRCAGVFGSNYDASYWGTLGYRSSANTNYGGYFTSSGSGSGKSAFSGSAEGIGIGAWGDLIGADVHGEVYGLYVEGRNFGIYSKGPVFSDQPAIQLQDVGERERAITYSSSSTEATISVSGQGNLVNGQGSVVFEDQFRKVISQQIPVIITVTPSGPSNGVYISTSGTDGFSVTENNGGTSNVSFFYMAIGRRAGYENPQLPAEVVASDFESKMTEGLHNDADRESSGKGVYYEGGSLHLGQSANMMKPAK